MGQQAQLHPGARRAESLDILPGWACTEVLSKAKDRRRSGYPTEEENPK